MSAAPLVLRTPGGRLALRIGRRALLVAGVLTLLALGTTLAALMLGDFPVSARDLFRSLTGQGEGPARMVIVEWRLPRAAMALLTGAALGVSGALFQSLTRNPLGSPDVIGLNAGAYSGALIVTVLFAGGSLAATAGAVAGGLITAALVYALAWRDGVQGFRLVLVGIGISAMATALNTWLLMNAQLEVAMGAAIWGAGSLNGVTLAALAPVIVILPALLALAAVLARPMRQLETGDDLARAHGIAVEPLRMALVALGVALCALATAAAGPIAFVALAAPQIGRRLTGSAGAALVPAALTGALLLALADLIAAQALSPRQVPVGTVTLVLGGLYLLWLIRREARRA